MHRFLVLLCLAVLGSVGSPADVAAQALVITNARVLDGTGRVIDRGAVVVRDGRIVSVSAGTVDVPGARAIDAGGMTVMPGFIDAHRHIMEGDAAQWLQERAAREMQAFLEAGFTTVLSAGDALEQALELRRRLERGEVTGPRLLVSGRAPLARAAGGGGGGPRVDPARLDQSRAPRTQAAAAIPPAETRATVDSLAKAGVDAIKTNIIVTPGGPEQETLSLVVREARRHNVPVITHAVTVQDTMAAVAAGVASLVHTPHIGQITEQQARTVAKAGIPMMSTLGVFVPAFDAENRPLFRDAGPFPMETLSSAGQGPVNARLLWDAGVVLGYGTDTRWRPRDALALELRPLALVFSPADIVSMLTRNAAAAILRADQLGTLEPGKLADIVMLTGDPLANVSDLLTVAVVIKGGAVVVDKR